MNACHCRLGSKCIPALVFACFLVPWVPLAEPVFDNTLHSYNTWYSSKFEMGDDAILSGTARTVTEFYLEYFGEFNSTGQQNARIRFYANDGPGMSPQTVLYESDPVPVYPGYNMVALRNLSVGVSNAFIWTVQFEGLSGVYSNRAGMLFYSPPVLGQSYKDCWLKQNGKWGTVLFTTAGMPANFSVRIIAQPDPDFTVASHTVRPDGRHDLTVTGPNFSSTQVWRTDDKIQWSLVSSFNMVSSPVSLVDDLPAPGNDRLYKAEPAPEPFLQLKPLVRTNSAGKSERVIQISGQPGRSFDLLNGFNLTDWFPMLNTYVFSSGVYEAASPPGSQLPIRFYEAKWAPDAPYVLGLPSLTPQGLLRILGSGPPGRGCVLQTSADLIQWSPVSTNFFGYTTSTFGFEMPAPANTTPLFIRGVPLP
jgi:hypothetical protein